jgi:Sugar phosphate isomerases/epimerases
MHGPFRGFPLDTEDADVRAVVHKRLDEGLDACGWLGATQMVIHSPVKAWHHENLLNQDDGWERFVDRVQAALAPAVARAATMGVQMVLENIEDRDPHARVKLVEAIDSPALRVSIDTGHAAWAHGICQAPAVDRYVRAAGNLLAHMHIQDTDNFADRHWPVGDGILPWQAILSEVAKLDSNPRLIIEIKDKGAVIRSAAWLQERGLAE